jgi:hypothetical protein
VNYGFALLIESVVAGLLALTIAYCMILNRRLKKLKADERSLKAIIGDLISATEAAERAVAGLKATARASENTLGERLRSAERLSVDLENQLRNGEGLVRQLGLIAGRAGDGAVRELRTDPSAMAVQAQAIADRARAHVRGVAA